MSMILWKNEEVSFRMITKVIYHHGNLKVPAAVMLGRRLAHT